MIKAVLFDMDGVLIDAKDWHYDALNRALDLFGMAIDRDAHLATFDGLSTRRKLEILTKTRGMPVKLHGFVNDLKQGYTEQITYAKCRPTFHHRDALARLKADGLQLAVCSNSVRKTVALMMRLSRLESYIDLQLSNEDVGNPKPDPEIYVAAIEHFRIRPEEALILEDNDHGIAAARSSGAHLMVVSSCADVTYGRVRQEVDRINASSRNSR